jgi:threonine/homoserine/homoserine lactone efflux protein
MICRSIRSTRQILPQLREWQPELASGCPPDVVSVDRMSLAYVLTAAGMICIPGPDVLLLTGRALQRGGAPALRTMCGTIVGYLVVTAVVAAGLGTVLAGWEALLVTLHVASVGYLLWLAAGAWRSAGDAVTTSTPHRSGRATSRGEWRDGFLTAALNPKGLLFFLALMPPFLDADRAARPQLLHMGLTFCGLAVLIYAGYVAATLAARRRLDLGGRATGRVSAGALAIAAAVVAGTALA